MSSPPGSGSGASSSRLSALDTFKFSDDIERELQQMEEGEQGEDSNGTSRVHASTIAAATSSSSSSSFGRSTLSSAAARAAALDPAAYARQHFTRPTAASSASHSSSAASSSLYPSGRRLSIDALAAEQAAGGARPQAARVLPPSSSSSSSTSSYPSISWQRGGGDDAEEDDAVSSSNFYDDDAHYFNLGASSFPLLNHHPLEEEEFGVGMGVGEEGTTLGTGGGGATTPSRHGQQHITSILHVPTSRLQSAAAPMLSSAGSYLPTLSSIWTFTTGTLPPPSLHALSEEWESYTSEASLEVDGSQPFILPDCPGFNESDLDLTLIHTYLQRLQPIIKEYQRNHPEDSFREKWKRMQQEEKERRERAQVRQQHQRQASREARRRRMGSHAMGSDWGTPHSDSYTATPASATAAAATPVQAHAAASLPSPSSSHSASLQRDLDECYASVPSIYFSPDFQMGALDFWRDPSDVDFILQLQQKQSAEKYALAGGNKGGGGAEGGGGGGGPTTPGGSTPINPYASFNALASFQSSGQYHLPSIAEQKAAQLRAYKASQERAAALNTLNEKHVALQVELSTYLDQVESTLLDQISVKSWAFFSALSNIQRLQQEIKECLQQIKGIRQHVAVLKSSLTEAGFGVIQRVRRVENINKVISTLELVATVLKTSPAIQLLLSTGDLSGCMSLLTATRQVLGSDLKGIKCLTNVHIKLAEHEKLIVEMMKREVVGVAMKGAGFYLHEGPDSVRSSSTSSSSSSPSCCSSRTLSEDEQDRLVPLVSHLIDLGHLAAVYHAYQQEVRTLIKQRLVNLVKEGLERVEQEGRERERKKREEEEKREGEQEGHTFNGVSEEKDPPLASAPTFPTAPDPDHAAVNSLLSDGPPGASSSEEGMASSSTPPAPAPSKSVPLPSLSPAVGAAGATTASGNSNAPSHATHAANPSIPPRYGERKQVTVALPITQQATAPVAAPVASSALPSARTPSPAPSAPPALSSSPAPSTPSSANSISARFIALDHTQFLSLLTPLFTSLMDLVQRSAAVRHLALTVLDNAGGPASPSSSSSASSSPSPTMDAAAKESLKRQLHEFLVSTLEYTHAKVGKILQTRSSVHASSLTLTQLRQFMDVILTFIQEGERLANKSFYPLRGILLVQAKSFVSAFHTRNMKLLGESLEKEKWVRVDVPPEVQAIIDAGWVTHKKVEATPTPTASPAPTTTTPAAPPSSSSTPSLPPIDPFADPAAPPSNGHAPTSGLASTISTTTKPPLPVWQSKSWEEVAETDEEEQQQQQADSKQNKTAAEAEPNASKPAAEEKKASAPAPAPDVKRVLFVARSSLPSSVSPSAPSNGSAAHLSGGFLKFPVVSSLLVLLRMIGEYVECSSQIQAVGSDILNKLVELLQMFNSRSCQLVLGAGAMHLAGLKSITATHLALASQSVGLLLTQLPVLRSLLSSRLPPKHHVLLSSLDRVGRDCQEHQREIFTKLVHIMGELLRNMVAKMEDTTWAKAGAKGAQTTSQNHGQTSAPTPPSPAPALTLEEAGRVEDCVKLLMKQTCSLHRALSDLLLSEQRDTIFRDISHLFLSCVLQFTKGVDMKQEQVKRKVDTNVQHIVTRLRTCAGVEETCLQQMEAIIG